MNLLWRSLKSLVIKNKLVFVLFCLCQVVSILSIIFVYGVIVARAEYNNSFDISNRQLHIPLEMPIGREELEQKIRLLAEDEQLHDAVEQYSVWMDAGDIRIKADMQYVEASPLFVSFGKYFTPEDFTSDNKVVLICEEIAFGDPSYEVGDTYSVMGESYTIQGIFNSFNTAYVEIPYTSLPSVEGIRRITITLKHPVDGDTAREYGKAIKELWDIVSVELPPASEASDVTENIFQMSGSLLIALLAAINFSALYRFLLRRRTENGTVYYPVVINAAYSNLGYGEKMSVWATIHKESGDETIPFSIYVAGILNSDQRYISLGSGSNVATSDNFFSKVSGSRSSPLLLFNKDLLPAEVKPLFSVQSTRFLFFDPTIDQATMEQNIAILSNQAYTFTLDEILENSEAEYNDNMRFYMPFCVCIYAIALIGIISFVALNTLQNAHYFSILYLCGCRWKNCLYICTGYVGVITVLSLVLSFFIYSVASFAGITEQMGLYFTMGNLWLTLAIIAVLVITALIIPFVMMRRFSVTEFIRKYEK